MTNVDSLMQAKDELPGQLCEALGLDPSRVTRIIIDVGRCAMPIVVYVEMVADTKVLEVDWSLLRGAVINREER